MNVFSSILKSSCLLLAFALTGCADAPPTTAATVTPAENGTGQQHLEPAPPHSNREIELGDVLMRSLIVWPRDEQDKHDTLATAKAFRVDHIVWIYENSPEFNRKVRQEGIGIGTTMAANAREFWHRNLSRSEAKKLVDRFTIRTLEGEQTMPQHFRNFDDHLVTHFVPDQADPEWLDYYVDYLKMLYGTGIDTLHRDDPASNSWAVRSGGTYTEHSIRFFREYLRENHTEDELARLGVTDVETFDIRQHFLDLGAPSDNSLWQWRGSPLMPLFLAAMMEADRRFFLMAKQRVEEETGMSIPWSLNGGGPIQKFEEAFDFRIGEYQNHHNQPQTILEMATYSHDANLTQAWISIVDRNYATNPDFVPDTRRHIGTAYAVGTIPLVPWCMFMHDAPRYYGSLDDFGDLYHFVSDNRQHFDGHTFSSVSGLAHDSRLYAWLPNRQIRFRHEPPSSPLRINEPGIFGFIRNHPNRTGAVIHLVDWSEEPDSFSITFPPQDVLGQETANLTLLRPGLPPEAIAPAYRGHTIDIPAVTPWGLLIVEPSEASPGALPAPVLNSPESIVAAAGTPIQFAEPANGKTLMVRLTDDPNSTESDFIPFRAESPPVLNRRGYIQAYLVDDRTGDRSEGLNTFHLVYRDFSGAPDDATGTGGGKDLSGSFTLVSGEMKVNDSFLAAPLTLLGNRVEKAVTTRGHTRLALDLEPEWEYFSVDVGIDDAEDRRPSARFQLWFDDRLAYESRVFNPSKLILNDEDREVTSIRVKIPRDAKRLELRVVPNGFFHEQNHAVWANPTVF